MKCLNNITKKPWGKFYDLAESKGKWHLKIIVVKKGQRLSLQRHTKRSELWIVAEGKVQAERSNKIYTLTSQKLIFIRKKEAHRIKALTNAVIVELTFGFHNEKDIIRLADDYGRA
ncbi:MAG: hypothetical protein A2812_01755 [Candidatus Staskawiczbacteria bacterium RIFCSPHIGHO2_01_FULL_36_16]|uniref:Mannose-6-phosphate isomerase type II C-terminal domain-containing protein n=1 Tax=Candidatus Staskawiczbacteria bacterium RIFCSPHIGHO2_01_FULL_36_16 TaxID=1802200 RepID=A0A1G2HJX8_9BACT|nr:MAG: hypothetical protein A2812_01755 [Candidatus Staskawiczbacteria bacterium RIFCSPHIGHO2_01_FULL_36_16]